MENKMLKVRQSAALSVFYEAATSANNNYFLNEIIRIILISFQ